jgi:hypothetical protein
MSGFHAPAFITPLLSTERKKILLGRTAHLGYLTLSPIARGLLGTSQSTSQAPTCFGASQESQDSGIQESDKYIGLGMSVLGKNNSCKKLGVNVGSGHSSYVDSTTGLDTLRRIASA